METRAEALRRRIRQDLANVETMAADYRWVLQHPTDVGLGTFARHVASLPILGITLLLVESHADRLARSLPTGAWWEGADDSPECEPPVVSRRYGNDNL